MNADVRQKPLIKLPLNPQIPSNTKRLNPQYKYKTIGTIKENGLAGDLERVNMFGVVQEILKPFSTTKNNKLTMICMLIDESDNGEIKFHFFTTEDTIIKEIEKGDILRLHRVKLELFNGTIDGRIFFSQDVVLFKKDTSDIAPITTAKNITITDEEKRRVETLKKWYIEYDGNLDKAVLLSDIIEKRKYKLLCKVTSEPKVEGNAVRVKVTDGSSVKNITPSMPLHRYKKKDFTEHIVTEILVQKQLDEYAKLKVGDIVLFRDVEVVPLENTQTSVLVINSPVTPKIVDEKDIHAVEVQRRIDLSQKTIIEKDQVLVIELTDVSQNLINKQDVLNTSSDLRTETAIQTRLQKNREKCVLEESHVNPTFVQCENKSCMRPKAKEKLLCGTKSVEVESSGESSGTKSRKQLFTPNLTDLSDATDETSDNVEILTPSVNKETDECIVNPANTSFNDIMEKVKTKHCTPKVQDHQRGVPGSENPNYLSPSKKTGETNKDNSRSPVVRLERISESESKGDSTRKRSLFAKNLEEDLEDASTVINLSYQNELINKSKLGNKRSRLESMSTVDRNLGPNKDVDDELGVGGQKVSSWLLHPGNKIAADQQNDVENCEFDVDVVKKILFCKDHESPDMSKYITSMCLRIQVFLLEVIPDPAIEPFNLVSGYCYSGCHQMFLFSKIHWNCMDDETSIPLCPECIKIEQEKSLLLMFMIELHVMDPQGRHATVLVVRNQAEQFLNCSVMDFVKDENIHKSRVKLLIDYTVPATLRCGYTPLLDISVTAMGRILCLTNSTLKLPASL